MPVRKPDFFIVGAPKCGTTALREYLSSHPEIFMPDRELLYFGSDLMSRSRKKKTLEWYLRYFSDWNGEPRVGEKSVWYFYSQMAPEEIKTFSPDARIIIMLRNPVERMYSHYYQLFYTGEEDIDDFETALKAEPERKMGQRIPPLNTMRQKLFYRDNARYAPNLQRYLKVFGSEQLHIIIYDDLKLHPKKMYMSALKFLDVNPYFQIEHRVVNANKRLRNASLRNLTRKPPIWASNIAQRLLPSGIRSRLRPMIKRFNTVKEHRPPMSTSLHMQLQEELLPDVEQVSRLLGRDLTHWCKDVQ
ncbi:MAG: sulfotransferase [Anaerolineales bacterium]|nr:sulfotransferase [Anaerolineales bacterium]